MIVLLKKKVLLPDCVIHYILSFLPIMDSSEYNNFVTSYKNRIERIRNIFNYINIQTILSKITYFYKFNHIFTNCISDNLIFSKVKEISSINFHQKVKREKYILKYFYYDEPVYFVYLDFNSSIVLKLLTYEITYFEILDLIKSEQKSKLYFEYDKYLNDSEHIMLIENRISLLNNEMINEIETVEIKIYKNENTCDINLYTEFVDFFEL
jgi:hypothetical protein